MSTAMSEASLLASLGTAWVHGCMTQGQNACHEAHKTHPGSSKRYNSTAQMSYSFVPLKPNLSNAGPPGRFNLSEMLYALSQKQKNLGERFVEKIDALVTLPFNQERSAATTYSFINKMKLSTCLGTFKLRRLWYDPAVAQTSVPAVSCQQTTGDHPPYRGYRYCTGVIDRCCLKNVRLWLAAHR